MKKSLSILMLAGLASSGMLMANQQTMSREVDENYLGKHHEEHGKKAKKHKHEKHAKHGKKHKRGQLDTHTEAREHTHKEHMEAKQHHKTAKQCLKKARMAAKAAHKKVKGMPNRATTKQEVVANAKRMKNVVMTDVEKAKMHSETGAMHLKHAGGKSDKVASRKFHGAAGHAHAAQTNYLNKLEKLTTDLIETLRKIFEEHKQEILKAANNAYEKTKKQVEHHIEKSDAKLHEAEKLADEAHAHHINDGHESNKNK